MAGCLLSPKGGNTHQCSRSRVSRVATVERLELSQQTHFESWWGCVSPNELIKPSWFACCDGGLNNGRQRATPLV